MNRFAPDVSRAGRPGHEDSIFALPKSRVLISIMNVLNDVFRVEQNHDIVGQKADCVNAKLVFGEQN